MSHNLRQCGSVVVLGAVIGAFATGNHARLNDDMVEGLTRVATHELHLEDRLH